MSRTDEAPREPIPFDDALRRLLKAPHKPQERGKTKAAKKPEKKQEPPK